MHIPLEDQKAYWNLSNAHQGQDLEPWKPWPSLVALVAVMALVATPEISGLQFIGEEGKGK